MIHKQQDMSTDCTENSEINDEMDGKKLLTCIAEIRLQPVKSMTVKKAQNKKVMNKKKAKLSQCWRAKTGLKRIIKWLKVKKTKQR